MYFAIYQAIAKDERRPGLYRDYPKDFFDLITVDECLRGESNWREILEYFEPAFQIGMTATPSRHDNRDTYRYFHNPLYTYSYHRNSQFVCGRTSEVGVAQHDVCELCALSRMGRTLFGPSG